MLAVLACLEGGELGTPRGVGAGYYAFEACQLGAQFAKLELLVGHAALKSLLGARTRGLFLGGKLLAQLGGAPVKLFVEHSGAHLRHNSGVVAFIDLEHCSTFRASYILHSDTKIRISRAQSK